MKILLLFFGFLKSSTPDPFKNSENYSPIRHEEIKEKLSDNKLRAYLAKANVLLGYDKPVKPLFEIEDLTPPWEDEDAWDALVPKERWRLRKDFYSQQREQDAEREKNKRAAQIEIDERMKVQGKFLEIIQHKGKHVAFYFVSQFNKFKEKQRLRKEGKSVEPELVRSGRGPTERPSLGKQPHFLFILADDMGYHDIGYHQAEILTPFMDKLATTGVRLEQYYVQPVCTPTRVQLMTGRYQIRYGMQHGVVRPPQPDGVPLDEKLLPEALRKCGYNTEMIGKWHLGMFTEDYLPQNRGFDHFMGFYTGSQDFYSHNKCFSGMCGYDFREATAGQPEVIRWDLNNTYSTGVFADELEKRLSKMNPSEPSFTYLSFQAVHSPLQAPRKFIDQYRNLKNRKRRNYNAMVTAMDTAIYKVVKAYKKYKFWDDTILIFSSDNGGNLKGGASNWPLRGAKGSLFEGGVRTIGFVHSPLLPVTRMGQVSHSLFHVSDWFPTLLQLAGCKTTDYGGKPLDGVSQVRQLWMGSNGNDHARDEILHGLDPLNKVKNTVDPRQFPIIKNRTFTVDVEGALRWKQWKLITGSIKQNPDQIRWSTPPTAMYGGAKTIFDKVELPRIAYIDDIKNGVEEQSLEQIVQLKNREKSRSRRSKDSLIELEEDLESDLSSGSEMKKSGEEREQEKQDSQILKKLMKKKSKKSQKVKKSWLRTSTNLKTKEPKKTKLVRLYNVVDDPFERNEISDEHPQVVNVMLTKLADYYDVSVPPRYPAYDLRADPALGDGVWRPWRLTPAQMRNMTAEDKKKYSQETHEMFNHVDDGTGIRLQFMENLLSSIRLKSAVSSSIGASTFSRKQLSPKENRSVRKQYNSARKEAREISKSSRSNQRHRHKNSRRDKTG